MPGKEEIHASDAPGEELIPGKTENLSSAMHKRANSVDGHDQRGRAGRGEAAAGNPDPRPLD